MKKFICLFFFLNSFAISYNQVINGTVIDKQSQCPVGFASVYFDGTFVGTIADQNGHFTLDVSRYVSMPLTISAVGYYSATVSNFLATNPVIIRLDQKIYNLNEVVVNGKSLEKERKKNLKIFKEHFIGTTSNARKCSILNEMDITFNYYSDKDTLKAFASKPILIENRALGYNILFYLNKFEYSRKNESCTFVGTMFFDEKTTFKKRSTQFYERRRRHAYLGSTMHLFRTLWSGDSLQTRFTLEDAAHNRLSFKQIVKQDSSGQKYLKYKGCLRIRYHYSESQIFFRNKGRLNFDKTGYFDPTSEQWSGDLVQRLIGDWLPYEYTFE